MTTIIREIPLHDLEVGNRIFVPNMFAAYTVDADGICRTLIGPEIQGVVYKVLEVDGARVRAEHEESGEIADETCGRDDVKVKIIEEKN